MTDLNLDKLYEEGFNPDEEYLGREKEVNKIEPLVSVCTATYQHAEYIEECIEGILIQKTDFPFEIIIGEDESDDGTREICKNYAEKYPDKIRLFLRDRKSSCIFNDQGNRINGFNGKWTRKSARGKYIALCEGDDYWTDPLKLQKQVDFLEENSEYGLVHTDCDNYIQKEGKWIRRANQYLVNHDEKISVDSEKLFTHLVKADYKIRTATNLFPRSFLYGSTIAVALVYTTNLKSNPSNSDK